MKDGGASTSDGSEVLLGQVDRNVGLTRALARAFLESRRENSPRTCIRMLRRADGTVITRDCARARCRIQRARWAVASLVGLSLLLATQAWAAFQFAQPPAEDAPVSYSGTRAGWIGPDEIQKLRTSRLHKLAPVQEAVNWIQSEYSRTAHDPRAIMGEIAWVNYE